VMAADTATDKLIEREIRARDERVLRAVNRGGLPTEAEVDAVNQALQKAYDLVACSSMWPRARISAISTARRWSAFRPSR
jgi:hypothetical protein